MLIHDAQSIETYQELSFIFSHCAALSSGPKSLTRYNATTDWQKKLSPEQYVVTREGGTEVVSNKDFFWGAGGGSASAAYQATKKWQITK